jgi:dolichol-phosphate mannosyltransferase
LGGIDWEVVFVDDDSPDGTAALCRECAQRDPRIRVIHRIGREGLSSACVEGMLATASPYLAVMDGDLQHDESLLPEMLALAKSQDLDVVVASRHLAGGGMGEFAADRVELSNLGRRLSRLVTKINVSDPMSGFFLLNRRVLDATMYRLSLMGFKVLLDMLASSPGPLRVGELPYTFRNRESGESKLDTFVELEYILLLADKLVGSYIPVRYFLYAMVGLSGVAVHFACLGLFHLLLGQGVIRAQASATVVALVWNFFLNNAFTYRDRRLRGARSLAKGLLVYAVGCSVGMLANLGVTGLVAGRGLPWYLAGGLGLIVGSVWNYGFASVFAWKIAQRRRRLRTESAHTPASARPEL